MKRRDILRNGLLTTLGFTLAPGFKSLAETAGKKRPAAGKSKNIILLVSDGMSMGTLNMADLLLQRKEGKGSHWLQLYRENKGHRALMDTASANSLVTDSAAASSSWGGGMRVNNGSLNVGPKGEKPQPIWQKFKAAGKAVGCVTTVPITHATPAGFCVNSSSRNAQPEIALEYLKLQFDVMMGGGLEYFSPAKREDKQDLLQAFRAHNFDVATTRQQMLQLKGQKPVLGVFHENGLPYALDRANDKQLLDKTPSLAEMTQTAINLMKRNKNGFVLQVEGGKVDWAAHANDAGGLLYDQLAFDEAVGIALDFAEKDRETLVIMTTDHGNANPGLIYGQDVNKHFDTIQQHRHTNEWVLNQLTKSSKVSMVQDLFAEAQGIRMKEEDVKLLLSHYDAINDVDIYNPRKLPYKLLADIQRQYTQVGWASMDHSADYVELVMHGPGSELLPPFLKNYELHNFMLRVAAMEERYLTVG
ncbi:alkaline phosphatase [Pontibacter sp. SGAir0037]|uniref:alkaline phosphatase n=1 Tax=Pontibacter sp. SGAir0037 TaxID=2571030 RepID=UPI0010CCB7BA|nr:alkaline phosphatase [Pontibacter sp. SGAir0037]QCR21614.1 alkaline phosphatase [Pontibacter sp. SGAir0037]